ncbi:MAG: heme exporter protein CcmD [Afipia sp.]|nr:heme exporter protein CcmD [Afipia sp.]
MALGPYASFIVTSYVLVALVIVALIVWIAGDHRHQMRTLHELEAKGVKRRAKRASGRSR